VSSTPTQLVDVNYVQSSIDPNGNQQPGGNKKKGQCNNRKGGRNNDNKIKDKTNNDRLKVNASEGKKEKWKVKFPCNLCIDDHLTHLCPKLKEDERLLYILVDVLTNLFAHNQKMPSISSNAENAASGSQNPPVHDSDRLCFNMFKSHINVATQSRDYIFAKVVLGIDSPSCSETPL
jgi:hypothetical protein